MSNVLEVKESKWKTSDGEDKTTWYVTLDDKTDNVPCYDALAAGFEIGKALPDGWEVTKSKAGKDYLKAPGKAKGGGGWSGGSSWYNSEAGVRFTQERMDRRTALMQAVEAKRIVEHIINVEGLLLVAGDFYEWLRQDSAGLFQPKPESGPSTSGRGEGPSDNPPPTSSRPSTSEGEGWVAAERVEEPVSGEGADNSSTLFAKLAEVYGSGPKALKAARVLYHDAPPTSLSVLSEAQVAELIELVSE